MGPSRIILHVTCAALAVRSFHAAAHAVETVLAGVEIVTAASVRPVSQPLIPRRLAIGVHGAKHCCAGCIRQHGAYAWLGRVSLGPAVSFVAREDGCVALMRQRVGEPGPFLRAEQVVEAEPSIHPRHISARRLEPNQRLVHVLEVKGCRDREARVNGLNAAPYPIAAADGDLAALRR